MRSFSFFNVGIYSCFPLSTVSTTSHFWNIVFIFINLKVFPNFSCYLFFNSLGYFFKSMLFSFHIFVKCPDLLLLLLISFHVVIEDILYGFYLLKFIYFCCLSGYFPCALECIFCCSVHCSICLLGLGSCSAQVFCFLFDLV